MARHVIAPGVSGVEGNGTTTALPQAEVERSDKTKMHFVMRSAVLRAGLRQSGMGCHRGPYGTTEVVP
jgi:hypothetical protein